MKSDKNTVMKKMKEGSPLFLVTFGVMLFAGLMNLSKVLQFLQNLLSLIFPILLGLLLAFVLNVPMRGFEKIQRNIYAKIKRKPSERIIQSLSLLFTLCSIILVIMIACRVAIPALLTSVKSIYPLLKEKWPEWISILNSYEIDFSAMTEWMSTLDMEQLSSNVGSVLGSAVNAATSTISIITNIIFGAVIAIYILLSKNVLTAQVKKISYANLRKKTAECLCYMGVLVRDTYAKFLSGQCVEAIILGSLIFASFYIFRLPYAGLIGFLTSIFAFVPYIGAFASCLIGVFLTLLVDPSKVFICIAVYMVVQFIENQFIYPHVVGSSVGLTPLWTLIAALIGGKLFGLIGIIFFIPLAAVLYIVVRDDTNRKLKEKEQDAVKVTEIHEDK